GRACERIRAMRIRIIAVLVAVYFVGLAGCSSQSTAIATSDPVGKLRLERLLKFYTMYKKVKKKAPASEPAFKENNKTLPPEYKEGLGVSADDVDGLFVSPRDGQKYHIEYGVMARPDGPNRALGWEETGQGGKRYVALTIGYVQLSDEEALQNYKKKK